MKKAAVPPLISGQKDRLALYSDPFIACCYFMPRLLSSQTLVFRMPLHMELSFRRIIVPTPCLLFWKGDEGLV